MPKLPTVSGKEAVRKLEASGYRVARQRGSHVQLVCDSDVGRRPVTIPLHKELKKGLLHKILRDSRLDVGAFIGL